MRGLIIAGNWKMNTLIAEGLELARSIRINTSSTRKVKAIICPPTTHLKSLADLLRGSAIELGAQNVHWEDSGAFTGEISASVLKEIGCQWAIIGHSERRTFFGESDRTVNQRVLKTLASGLNPIMCIGETLEERENGHTFQVLERQIQTGLQDIDDADMASAVIAYEPVWAIGTGVTASPEQAQEAHRFIRDKLSQIFNDETASNVPILYGGSMNSKNAEVLLNCPDVDGGLIGGASLQAQNFNTIVQIAGEVNK